jgi:hypothetical protein
MYLSHVKRVRQSDNASRSQTPDLVAAAVELPEPAGLPPGQVWPTYAHPDEKSLSQRGGVRHGLDRAACTVHTDKLYDHTLIIILIVSHYYYACMPAMTTSVIESIEQAGMHACRQEGDGLSWR